MRILVVGGGGREHALCWAIGASPLCTALSCAPGNAGIAAVATCLPIAADDVGALVAHAVADSVDFVVVGPEVPLVAGLVDRLTAAGIKAFGPTAAAAALEGSKGFMKDLCARHGIPTAAYRRCTDAAVAKAWAADRLATDGGVVVKADGLTAGKGVTVAGDVASANAAIDAALTDRVFGGAGAELVLEERLVGTELSFFALVDGTTVLPLAGAQDYKRAGDGDVGPNTGGMGAVSPAPALTTALEDTIMATIARPLVAAMAAAGRPYQGVLYAGVMLTATGPQLLEVNVRFGDPETQALIPRLKSDLLPALIATTDGVLKTFALRWYDEAAVTVVMASDGYPGTTARGSEIRGLGDLVDMGDLFVFHAGTRAEGGRLLADGGRVLAITALGPDAAAARRRAYAAIERIDWPEGFCRRDIGGRDPD